MHNSLFIRNVVQKLLSWVISSEARQAIIKYCKESDCQEFIVGTEDGTGYQLRLDSPNKQFHFATKYLVCPNMKVNNLKKVVKCLETMQPQIYVPPHVADQARLSLERMLQVK